MEVLVSAVVGDLVGRSISFVIDRYYRQQQADAGDDLQSLHRLLLRIKTTILEAEGRHITNQAMLRQLQMLREGMFKGYYLLDTIQYRMLQRDDGEVGDHSLSSPKFIPAKRLCFSARRLNKAFRGGERKELDKMLGSLQHVVDDTKEFVFFLKGYRPIYRQPYSMHLVMDKCMFGRQAEMERIINFLLQEEPLGAESVGILPIIGPARVGKSTLVEHVCYDEKVRSFFSSIVCFSGSDIERKNLADLKDSGVVKHRSHTAHERSLIIIEFLEDVDLDEERWIRLYSSRSCIPHGSKLIITSRSERFMNVGTTQPLMLNFLPRDIYWYFFKVVAFGSTNPEDHPLLISTLMEIAEALNGCFIGANVMAGQLRANFCTQHWRNFLRCHRDIIEKHVILFGEHPFTLLQNNHPIYLWKNPRAPKLFVVHDYRTHCPKIDVPRVMLHDVQAGIAEAEGKFEVLVWRSNIPPYHSYVMSCEAQVQQHAVVKRKRSWQRGI